MLRQCCGHLARWALAACVLLSTGATHGAEPANVVLVIDQKHPVYEELIESLRHHLDRRTGAVPAVSVAVLSDTPAARLFPAPQKLPDLVVPVGTTAAAQVAELDLPRPVLNVLVPRISFEEIARRRAASGAGQFSAIYVDQPLERRLDLIKLMLPEARRIGAVLGPGNEAVERELSEAGERRRLRIQLRKITAQDNLVTALDQVLEKSDVMLGFVDPLVFNRTNAQNVLLTAYRHRVPLIGVSPAYVQAGALAAVYSTPAQIGRQLAETLAGFARRPNGKLPAPQYPEYFSVAINPQVAQALGLVVDEEESLERKLAAPE